MAKGGRVLVPADKIAYVEFGGPEARRVGFGNIVLCPACVLPCTHRPGLAEGWGLPWYCG